MRLPTSERAGWVLVVAGGALALVALNLWWVLAYRKGYPLNVDEAGYMTIGMNDYLSLQNSGLHGLWSAVQSQTPNAPLVPAIASLVMIAKPGIMAGFVVLIGFLALLVFASYGIGERLAGPRLGALAALAVATSEGALLFTREYIFALPTAALLSCAVYALLRSERMAVRRWAIACGGALGLMLLARTMAVAFVPGVLVAGLVSMLAWDHTDLRRRLVNFGLAVVAAVVVAATWYFHNLEPVVEYLTSYGYGAHSAYYGAQHSIVSWGRFRAVAERMVHDDLLVPLAALVLIGLVTLAILAIRRVATSGNRRAALLQLLAGDAASVAIVVAAGTAALMSSRNGGDGFTLPLSMLLPSLAVAALPRFRLAVVPVTALVAAIAALNIAATSDLWGGLAKRHFVSVPGFGELPWANGIPHAVEAIRAQVPGPETEFDSRDGGWPEADKALAAALLRRTESGGGLPLAAFASRNRAISSNSVELAALFDTHRAIPFTQLNAEPSDTVANYAHELSAPEFGQPGTLITMSRNTEDFPPLVSQGKAETAARDLGFRRIWAETLPDGRQLRLWIRKAGPPVQSAIAQRGSAPLLRARKRDKRGLAIQSGGR